jgi:predicted secreted hydrolase
MSEPVTASRTGRIVAGVLIVALLVTGVAGFWWLTRAPAPASPLNIGVPGDTAGFARALSPRAFTFPADHGPHTDFQTEWWYYTGNLTTEAGERYGYQLTFFRRGLSPSSLPRTSDLATNQIYFAHFAVTDGPANTHTAAERFSRGAGGLAGASGEPYRVWLEDWRVESLTADGSSVHLVARDGDQAIDLTLRAVKPIVAHGDHGLSAKSQAPGNASYYLSYTRLATTGSLTRSNAQVVAVSGESWFDHEWSTSALGPGSVGWDWFSIQLSDGRELMFFQIRRDDGTLEPASGGTLVALDGTPQRLDVGDVQIDVQSTWRSPATGGVYPARWRLRVPSAQIDIELIPIVADQEMRVSFVYWEGAVQITGASQGTAVVGQGFVEMTGYTRSIAGQF